MTTEAQLASLPRIAFGTLPSDPLQVIAVKRGEVGYWNDRRFNDAETAAAYATYRNDRLGITPAIAEAMQYGSVFGFDIPLIGELIERAKP